VAEPGEPRLEYDPSLSLMDRYQAKAAELGVSARTVQRWVAALQESGPAGIADGRIQRAADPLGGVDERWLQMCPVTLRWVRTELTIAMDLYSRCITGLRLSSVSTKSVDAALVPFEALRPGSRQHTSGGLLPYAGLPDLVVAGDGTAGLAGVATETIVAT